MWPGVIVLGKYPRSTDRRIDVPVALGAWAIMRDVTTCFVDLVRRCTIDATMRDWVEELFVLQIVTEIVASLLLYGLRE